jgi:alpha-1,2-mannosyltransferase
MTDSREPPVGRGTRLSRDVGRLVTAGWGAAATIALCLAVFSPGTGPVDLQVYRIGGQAWLEGIRLYAPDFPAPLGGPPLPFTYPPLAAVLFSLLTTVPWTLAVLLWTAAGIAALTWVCLLVARSVLPAPTASLVGLGVAGASCLLLEPVRSTFDFGQVNLVLLALVVADCLVVRPQWSRGALVGLAAAVKLTPLALLLYFLVRRDRRAAATAVVSFVVFGLIGYSAAPADSVQYWLHTIHDTSRVGGLAFAFNQSARGFLSRFGVDERVELLLWGSVVLLVVFLAVRGARNAVAMGQDALAMLVVASAALLLSPVSWSHHWVWAAPAVVLALAILRGLLRIATTGALVVVFGTGPHSLLPVTGDRELQWSWWQHLVGNSYLWTALAFLAVMARTTTRGLIGHRLDHRGVRARPGSA